MRSVRECVYVCPAQWPAILLVLLTQGRTRTTQYPRGRRDQAGIPTYNFDSGVDTNVEEVPALYFPSSMEWASLPLLYLHGNSFFEEALMHGLTRMEIHTAAPNSQCAPSEDGQWQYRAAGRVRSSYFPWCFPNLVTVVLLDNWLIDTKKIA